MQIHNGRNEVLSADEQHFFNIQAFPVFDMISGLKNMHANQILFKEIIKNLLEQDFPIEKKAFSDAHHRLDWTIIEKLAHKMKGGSIYIGLSQLQQACQYFEDYYYSGQKNLLEPLYQQIIVTLDASQQALENWLTTQ